MAATTTFKMEPTDHAILRAILLFHAGSIDIEALKIIITTNGYGVLEPERTVRQLAYICETLANKIS